MAGGVGGLPTYPSNVPAESTEKAEASPARRAMLRKTPSAIGERQTLAVQTKRMPMGTVSSDRRMSNNCDQDLDPNYSSPKGRFVETKYRPLAMSLLCLIGSGRREGWPTPPLPQRRGFGPLVSPPICAAPTGNRPGVSRAYSLTTACKCC